MAEQARSCAKCSTLMVGGYLLDHKHGAVTQSQWVEGAPEISYWVGLKTDERPVLPLVSFRCPKCWYVELYAPPA